LKVTAAVLEKEGEYLIAKRKKNDILGGLWEFPGGKIEEGETAEECLKREIKEELNIIVEVNELILSKHHKYPKGCFELIAFKVKYISGEIILNEHDDYKWVPYEKLAMFNFLPADIPIIDKLKNNDRL
tara:strand:- start:62 stop:448 length:387 start_codon:yes stop_codon:yes gene_type:complete